MPETYWSLERLGVLDKLKQSSFVKKYSVQFVTAGGKESQPFFFDKHDPRDCSQTWQVERAEFDKLLFDNANEKGADCRDETRVLEVLFDGQRATGARIQSADGSKQDVTARVVVDATGQQALIANRLNLTVPISSLKNAAVWTYYRGAAREAGPHGGATVILHTESKEAWLWYIPLQNDVTSVGVVANHQYLLKGRGTPSDVFEEELRNCPGMVTRLRNAERVDDHRVAKEFSYTTRQHAGDGWVLVGDAFGFLDPIYSSGVFFALKTGEMAADCVIEGLRSNDTTAPILGKWCDEFSQGAQWIGRLVSAFYSSDFSFGHFMKQHPEHLGNLVDLLIGRVFHDRAGHIFDDLEPELRRAQTSQP